MIFFAFCFFPSLYRYVTHIIETVEGRSISNELKKIQDRSLFPDNIGSVTESDLQKLNIPYAHLAAYRKQLKNNLQENVSTTKNMSASTISSSDEEQTP